MNQIETDDTNDHFATMVGEALRIDADRAPELPDEWSETDLVPIVSISSRQPRRLAVAVGLTAAAATLAGIAFVAPSPWSTTDSANEAGEWLPAGTEFPTTDLGPATTIWGGPAVEDLTRTIGIDGHPSQVVTRSMRYDNGEAAEEFFCTWEGGSGGCRPASLAASWSISITSSIENGVADTDLWHLEGLSAEVAYVSYTTADQQLWQRPVFGFVAFPYLGSEPLVIGYDRTGTEVGRYSEADYFELARTYVPPRQAELSDAEQLELWELTGTSMTECLTAAGGLIGEGGVATFAGDVDQVAVWDACVPEVEATVAARIAEIDPRMFQPSAEAANEKGYSQTTVTTTSD